MNVLAKKSFNQPDETKQLEKAKIEIITINGKSLQKVTAEPGWQWSKHVKPIVGGESCQQDHLIYIVSGKLASQMDSREKMEFNSGEVATIPPGHDGWTVGDERVVWIEIPH